MLDDERVLVVGALENCAGRLAGAYVLEGVRRGADGRCTRVSGARACSMGGLSAPLVVGPPLPPRGLGFENEPHDEKPDEKPVEGV